MSSEVPKEVPTKQIFGMPRRTFVTVAGLSFAEVGASTYFLERTVFRGKHAPSESKGFSEFGEMNPQDVRSNITSLANNALLLYYAKDSSPLLQKRMKPTQAELTGNPVMQFTMSLRKRDTNVLIKVEVPMADYSAIKGKKPVPSDLVNWLSENASSLTFTVSDSNVGIITSSNIQLESDGVNWRQTDSNEASTATTSENELRNSASHNPKKFVPLTQKRLEGLELAGEGAYLFMPTKPTFKAI